MDYGKKNDRIAVGVLLDSVSGYFNHRVISELLASSAELGIKLVFYFGGQLDRDRTSGNFSWIYSLPDPGIIDALIVLPHSVSPYNPRSATMAVLERLGNIPVYTLFYLLEGHYGIDCDETKALERMIDHLTDYHGYRRFAVLLGPDGEGTISRKRLGDIERRLRDHGISLRQESVFSGDYSPESGKAAAHEILNQEGDSPEILICMNDQTATAAITELQNNGIAVPQDIAVVSFDEIDSTTVLPCGVSTIAFPLSSMVLHLLARIRSDAEGTTSYEPEQMLLPARFVHRTSCGCSQWNEAELTRADGFTPPDDRVEDDEQLRKAAALQHDLRKIVDRCVSSRNPEPFRLFIDETIQNQRSVGELPSVILDAFTMQWTISLVTHPNAEDQTFLNALFIDAFRRIVQSNIDAFKRMHQRDLGALNFYKNGQTLLAEKISLHTSLVGIGANITSLGVDRAQLVLISPYNPELGEVRIDYRRRSRLDIPEGNYRTMEIKRLLMEGIDATTDPIMVFCLAHNNATFGYLTMAISDSQYDQYSLVQESLSHIIEAAVTNDELSAHIRKLTRNNDTLSRISQIDEFTGLFNRRALYGRGKDLFDRALAAGKSSCIIFVDMDGLKTINDSWGHKEGDAAIKSLAEIFRRTFRENDLLVRYGGDEFVIIMTDISREALDGALQRVKAQLASFNEKKNHPWTLSASWGFVFNAPGERVKSFESIIEESDINLYQEKRKKKRAL